MHSMHIVRHVIVIMAVASCAGAENLLENAGFEEWQGPAAAPWKSFVMPQPGAMSGRESTAHSGAWAAMLHTPQPYEKEPANNWSQSVSRPLGGKRLTLSGFVKTRDATEAALWLQCWKKPWALVDFVTSSTATPIAGTQDWRAVSVTMNIPKSTDFIVVRCVLLGCGTAWFDDMALSEAEDEVPVPPELPEKPGSGEEPEDRVLTAQVAERQQLEELLDAHATLKQAVKELQMTNDTLMEQVWLLYEEVKDLRDRVSALKAAAEDAEAAPPSPLVPIERGATEETP